MEVFQLSWPSPRYLPWLAVVASLSATAALCLLSFLEHRRSLRPSDLIVSYLSASVVCDFVWIAASWPSLYVSTRASRFMCLYAAQVLFRFALLLLESLGKESALHPGYQNLAPEETSGLFQRTLFWWVNRILADGSNGILRTQGLPALPESLSSQALRSTILKAWDRRGS